jgi:ABC-type branched-subunit amino acid transport system ATPase component
VSGPATDLLRLAGVTVARGGRPVVHDVSLEIPRGEVTALLGPNGAGKSTLVLAVAGVLRPLAGSIDLGGRELRGRRPENIRRAGVAVVPEGRRLLSELSVEDNLQVATYSLTRDEARTGRAYALELFPELTKRLELPARSLSGGEQQMLVLAQALVSQPRFIRARPRQPRARDGPLARPVLRAGERAAGASRAPAVLVPPRRRGCRQRRGVRRGVVRTPASRRR